MTEDLRYFELMYAPRMTQSHLLICICSAGGSEYLVSAYCTSICRREQTQFLKFLVFWIHCSPECNHHTLIPFCRKGYLVGMSVSTSGFALRNNGSCQANEVDCGVTKAPYHACCPADSFCPSQYNVDVSLNFLREIVYLLIRSP